jgi:hypothetical protein
MRMENQLPERKSLRFYALIGKIPRVLIERVTSNW